MARTPNPNLVVDRSMKDGITSGARSVIADYAIVRKVVVNRDFAGAALGIAR